MELISSSLAQPVTDYFQTWNRKKAFQAFKSHKVEIMYVCAQDAQSANIFYRFADAFTKKRERIHRKFIKVMVVTSKVLVCHNLHVSTDSVHPIQGRKHGELRAELSIIPWPDGIRLHITFRQQDAITLTFRHQDALTSPQQFLFKQIFFNSLFCRHHRLRAKYHQYRHHEHQQQQQQQQMLNGFAVRGVWATAWHKLHICRHWTKVMAGWLAGKTLYCWTPFEGELFTGGGVQHAV